MLLQNVAPPLTDCGRHEQKQRAASAVSVFFVLSAFKTVRIVVWPGHKDSPDQEHRNKYIVNLFQISIFVVILGLKVSPARHGRL